MGNDTTKEKVPSNILNELQNKNVHDDWGFLISSRLVEDWARYIHKRNKVLIRTNVSENATSPEYFSKKTIEAMKEHLTKSLIESGVVQLKYRGNMNSRSGNLYIDHLNEISKLHPNILEQIEKDLPRTLPDNIHFEKKIESLSRILKSYAIRNNIIGYCQGMNMIVGMLLVFGLSEEDCFWVLCHIVENICPGYFSEKMKGSGIDQFVLDDLLERIYPNLHQHLRKHDVDTLFFSQKWFVVLFFDVLPSETLMRVWCLFFSEGSVVLFRTGIAIFSEIKDKLFECHDTNTLCEIIRDGPSKLFDSKEFLKKINDLKGRITPEIVETLREKYHKQLEQRNAYRLSLRLSKQ